MTVEEEVWLVKMFSELYDKAALTGICKGESPDFTAQLDLTKVGIEVTEVFQNQKFQQYSSESGSFTDALIKKLQPYVHFTFSIGITFDRTCPVTKSRKEKIIDKVKEICLKKMNTLKNREYIYLDSYNDALPPEIASIFIDREDRLDVSYDYKPEGGTFAELTIEYIEQILSKKEERARKYRRCDQLWLLIREGNYYAGSFSKIKIDIPIKSTFDKVFLLRTRHRELIELK